MDDRSGHDRQSAEELREALLDLDRSREHERQMRRLTEGLLEGLRVLTRARDTRQMFEELGAVLQRFVPFDRMFLLQQDGPEAPLLTVHASGPFVSNPWHLGPMMMRVLAGHIVSVFNVAPVIEWQLQPEAFREAVRSAIHVPISTGNRASVLVFTHLQTAHFNRLHVELLERFAPLIEQAMASLAYRQRLEEHTERIQYLATHDALTGLPNRSSLDDRVTALSHHARHSGERLALLFIDLDRFKQVNDSFGHAVGDALLKVIAKRLQHQVRETDTVTRLGGDEFVVILTGVCEAAAVHGVASKILAAVEEPVNVDGHTLYVSASIGAAMCPDDGTDLASLLQFADAAMYQAKDDGRNAVRFYAAGMSESARAQMELSAALRHAVARGEFELHYQPRMLMSTNGVVGMEALIRWRHPERGLLMPGEFLKRAEEDGLIVDIGEWVLNEACRQARAWLDAGLPPIRLSVNVSPRQMHRPQDLLDKLDAALARTGFPAALLELEITESMVMHNPTQAAEVLLQIRHRGASIAIDDFGTGYSSLAHLKRFPVSQLKIDRSFVRDIAHDPDDAAIAQAVVSLGQALGIGVVAEGVEDAQQVALLRDMGCDEVQGFFFSRPLAPAAMEAFLRQGLTPRVASHAEAMQPSGEVSHRPTLEAVVDRLGSRCPVGDLLPTGDVFARPAQG